MKFLLELLDDDNEQSASLAMAELLKSDSASLDRCLCSLQESDDPRLRRRVHQLESALHARRKRLVRESRLRKPSDDSLKDRCVELHLSWFDNDLAENVEKQWAELSAGLKKAAGRRPALRDVAEYLSGAGFQAPLNDDINADFYCFGAVIDDHYGADVLLSVIAVQLMRESGQEAVIVRETDDFGVMDRDGNLLFPAFDWEYRAHRPFSKRAPECSVMTDPQVVRYIAAMLFLCAVGCDSFRYVYTVGNMLASLAGVPDAPAGLPFPYKRNLNLND